MRDERGAAAVELALVLPVLLMLLFGIVEVGRGYEAKIALADAARAGARAAAVGRDPVAAVKGATSELTSTLLQVTAPTAACATGQPVAVQATYPYTWRIPFVGEGTVTMHSTSVMRCGG
jgi:Flp pilus assembly protein TadG